MTLPYSADQPNTRYDLYYMGDLVTPYFLNAICETTMPLTLTILAVSILEGGCCKNLLKVRLDTA